MPFLHRLAFTVLASSIVSSGCMLAQSTQVRGADSWSSTKVPGVEILPLPGLPFSGMGSTVWTRAVDGGGTVTTYLQAKDFRDSQGRLYRERHHFTADQNADPRTTLYEFTIYDPVARTQTECDVHTRSCHISSYRPPVEKPLQPVGPFDQGKRLLTRQSLGNQWIDGLPVLGTLEQVAITPGTLGNDTTLTTSREFWYSADLQTNLSVIRNDPRQGKQTVSLKILSRDEPDASVFAVPHGYSVVDDRHAVRAVTSN